MCQRRQNSRIDFCKIGAFKVVHEPEAHHLRRADGNVGIAGKVAVDLHAEQQRRKHERRAGLHVARK